MPTTFAFRAASAAGAIEEGTLEAESRAAVRAAMASRGLFLLELGERGTSVAHRSPISAADLALGLRMLADLLESGLSVGRALHAFEDLAPRGWRPALPSIRQSVREGQGLASALASAPVQIPPLVIGIAQAGEAGSGIAPAIRRAAELAEATAETKSALYSALAYPAIVAVAGIGAITVLVTVVLPRFATILADLGQSLPASTQFVLTAANVSHAVLIPGLCSCALAVVLFRAMTATSRGRRAWHRSLLRVPMIGPIRRAAAAARVQYSLAALIESGIMLASALPFAARSADDAEIEARVRECRVDVLEGKTLSCALESHDATTPTSIRLIRAGEESGRLAAMLAHAASIEQKRVSRLIGGAVRLLEPALLLTFAMIVAFVAAALLQAIYSVRPTA